MDSDKSQLYRKLTGFNTAVLYDSASRLKLNGALHGISPVSQGARLAGPALTVRYGPAGGSALGMNLYDIMHAAPKGAVLVVEAPTDGWIAGANTTNFAARCLMVGIVTDGCIRDIADIRKSGFPVFSRGAAVEGYAKQLMLAEVGGLIHCGGVDIRSGDWIAGDDDGVMRISMDRMEDVAYQAEDIQEIDAFQAAAISRGMPLAELQVNLKRWGVLRA